ncbi:hypothetical protein DPMN_187488 [Dreissena polymorpha]|uniref:Uncharacterized protein n=1 Tax=Dreissena polymorpha TaxID=45954 RepID=A0A9D4IAH0_DREPO|nr:hypothetical protein DPMN_187488 [Dreissena polymorpha]
MKNAPAPGGHVFKATGTIFELVRDIIGTNCLTKFNEDRTIDVASRVFKRRNAPTPGAHVFEPTATIFELVQYIIRTNLLTKFHDDGNKPEPFFVKDITGTNVLTKFYEDLTIDVSSRVLKR